MKHLNFIVNRNGGCGAHTGKEANTPPCCSKRASRFVWVLVLMLTIGVGQMWGATEKLTMSEMGWTATSTKPTSIPATTATIGVAKNSAGTDPTYYSDGLRIYGVKKATTGGTIAFTAKTNVTIKGIDFTYTVSNSGVLNIKTGSGSYNTGTKKWTGTLNAGDAVSLVVTNNTNNNPQVRITEIKIQYLAKVTFNANGGSCGTSNVTQADTASTVSLPTPTRDGFTCIGWYTAADGGSKRGNAGGSYKPTASETLYAQWEAETPAFAITPATNDEDKGTVSILGNVITGSPKTGYRYASPAYSVSPENSATVSQNGNAFTVTPSANTTVTINFEAIPTHTLNYHDGDGDGTKSNVTEGTNLIEALGTPAASCDATSTTFVGWTTSEIATKTNTAPTFVAADAVVNSTTAAATYYAVYAKGTETQTPIANSWTRITSTSQLTDGATVMLVQYYSGYAINTNPGATSCTANAEITNSNTSLRWIAEQSGTKWKFKTSASKYLSTSALDNNTGLSLDATYDEWTITVDNGGGTGSNNEYNNANCFKLNNGSDLEYYSNIFKLYTWSLKYSSAYPFYIYIQKTNSSVSYSEYLTTCCTELGSINGSFFWTTHFCPAWPAKHRL